MPFVSRSKLFQRSVSRSKAFFARSLRRRAACKTKLGTAPLLFGALLFLVPPLFAALVSDAPSLNSVPFVNPANAAYRSRDAVRSNDAIPYFFNPSARPALFSELAGIPSVSPDGENDANGENDVFSAPTISIDSIAPTVRLPLDAPSPSLSSTAPIIRGGYISNLQIAPYRGRVFAYADGSWGKQTEQTTDPFAAGFNVASFGGGVGQDWRLSKNAIWGLGFQGRDVQLDPAASIYETEIESLAGFLRLSLFGPLWRLDLSIGAAKNWNEQSFGFNDVTKFSSSQWNYEAEFGVRFDKGYTRVEPLVNVRVLTLQEPTEAERRLVRDGRPNDYADASYRLKLGSRFSWEYATHLATLKPYLTATWAHEFGDRALYTVGENSPFPIAYRYARHKMARDRLDLGGGVDAALRDTVDVFFHYDVEFAKEYSNYLFYAGFHKKF